MHLDCYRYFVIYITITFQLARCQDWTRVAGNKVIDRLSTAGYPGGRSRSSVWTSNGVVWIFGGSGYTDVGTGKAHLLNDVWNFSNDTQQFKLQNPGTCTLKADPLLNSSLAPSERQHAAMCGYRDKLFVFGGFGESGISLGDLWIFDTNSRNWLEHNLSNSSSSSGPSARGHSAVWCFESSMYLFGGMNDIKIIFADMWMFDLLSLTWVQLHAGVPQNYLPYPAGRNGALVWVSDRVLYMFSGNINSSFSFAVPIAGLTSELWGYHLQNSSWQFVTSISHLSRNLPGGRLGSATWTDSDSNLWLFGGAGTQNGPHSLPHFSQLLSDVWRFDISVQCWDFIGDRDSGETSGRYGELGEMSINNFPGARAEMMCWEGANNQVYIFGGVGYDEMNFYGYLNDLWRVDLSAVVSQEYPVSWLLLLSFFGVASSLLVVMLIFAMCSRKNQHRQEGRLQFKLIPEYYRLNNDVT